MKRILILFAIAACGEPAVIVDEAPKPVPAPAPVAAPPAPAPPEEAGLPQNDGETRTLPLRDLSVRITAHTPVPGVPCWTFVSDGLGPQEVAFTVRRDRETELSPLLHFLQSAKDQGMAGIPRLGEMHGMAEEGPGFLSTKRFYTVLFAPPIPVDAVQGTDDALTGLLLDKRETEQLQVAGAQRIVSRLGLWGGRYPTTPWADPDRPAMVPADPVAVPEPSVYAPTLQVTQVDGDLEIAIGSSDLQRLEQRGSLAKPGPLRLLGGQSPDLDGLLVLKADGSTTAITAGEGRTRLGLNGLVLRPASVDQLGYVEDLAGLELTDASWKALWAGLAAGNGQLTLKGGNVTLKRPAGDIAFTLPTPEPVEVPSQPVTVEGVELLLSQLEVGARIPVDDLKTAIGMLEIELINVVTDRPAPVPSMHLEVVYKPGGTVEFAPHWPGDAPTGTWWPELEAALRALEVPAVKGPVSFRLKLRFDPR